MSDYWALSILRFMCLPSGGWGQGAGSPGADACPLMGGTGSRASSGPLVSGAGSGYRCPGPGCQGVGSGQVVHETVSQWLAAGSWGVPRIVSEDWYVGLGPGPSGTQGQVLRWLWSSEGLNGAHLPWVVLCTCLASCLT